MILETISVGPLETNCYILAVQENSPAIIIDPGDDEKKIRQVLSKYNLKQQWLLIRTAITTILAAMINLE